MFVRYKLFKLTVQLIVNPEEFVKQVFKAFNFDLASLFLLHEASTITNEPF